ncbi:MAG: hypothetical protein KGL57_11385 [Burkholderiales bacterium]|nr:hypothetical protein [Burkholderiales bacterium]
MNKIWSMSTTGLLAGLMASVLALSALPLYAAPFKPLDRATAKHLLDPATYQQPTIVVLWSSDCTHCKKNLGMLSKLVQSNKKVRVITVAVEPETAALAPILDRNKMPDERYAYGNENPDAIAYAMDPAWAGELPRTYLFNGAGRKEGVSGVLTEQMVSKALSRP